MKVLHLGKLFLLLCFIYWIIPGCKKVELPSVKTVLISDVTENAAVIHYKIVGDGGGSVTYHGVCWNTNSNPTTSLTTKTVDGGPYGGARGDYWVVLSGLDYGKSYHVRAYATNSAGTAYSDDQSFSTRAIIPPDGIKIKPVSALGSYAAISGGSFTATGGASEVEFGLCWDVIQGPTTGSGKVFTIYSEPTSFTSIMTNFSPNTTYFARAYVANAAGTIYGDEISFTTTSNVTDIENRIYHTVNIGTQVWLMENLAGTKYNDGNSIPLVTDQALWNNLNTPAYCWYNNEKPQAGDFKGALYNWHAVNTGKLCPSGFHIPTIEEWTVLTTYLGGPSAAAGEMKKPGEMQWPNVPNSPINSDSCLFWGIACGVRDTITGFEADNGCGVFETCRYWSSTPSVTSNAWSLILYNGNAEAVEYSRKNGLSVRCLKD